MNPIKIFCEKDVVMNEEHGCDEMRSCFCLFKCNYISPTFVQACNALPIIKFTNLRLQWSSCLAWRPTSRRVVSVRRGEANLERVWRLCC
jgi:hypothetical protein